MRRWPTCSRLGWLITAGVWLALTGCGSSSGARFGLFPDVHRLVEPARSMREQSGPPAGIARELDKQVMGPYIIEPGDVLLVQPASLDSPVRLPGDQPVLPDGTIQLGRFGRPYVVGKTMEQIEGEINSLIRSQVSDAGFISVRLVTRDSKVYYVLGEVNAPGAFQLKGRETVLDAIVAAGGLNSNASRGRILVSRPTAPDSCRIVLPVDYNGIVQIGDTTTNYQVRAGDRIFVPSRTMWEDLAALCKGKKEKACLPQVLCPPAVLGAPVHAGPVIVDRPPTAPVPLPAPTPTSPPAASNPPAPPTPGPYTPENVSQTFRKEGG
jgi:protein involved in polysaccharide export with SLBB domain